MIGKFILRIILLAVSIYRCSYTFTTHVFSMSRIYIIRNNKPILYIFV